MPRRVLLLGGTAEARDLARRARGLHVTTSLAGRTDAPDVPDDIRIGGFGGDAGFRAALADYAAVLDATHPYAAMMSDRAARICREGLIPHLRLTRPPWPPRPGWITHPDARAAARALPRGARVLLTTGPGSLAPFLGRGLTLWCRRIDPAPPEPGVDWIVGRPGDRDAEAALMRRLDIGHLVTKNAGGRRWAKLDAASDVGVRVHVIDRPPDPPGDMTDDPDAAFAFLAAHADRRDPG